MASSLYLHRTQTGQQTHHTQNTGVSLSSDVEYHDSTDIKLVLNFTPKEIQLVRKTWNEMISDDVAKDATNSTHQASIASSLFCIQFYSNLLTMEPELEKMFPSIKHQAVSFSGVLATAIINLESLETLDDYLSNLGKRHARILGIDPPHFELMGVAFLKTFQDRFGHNFTLELERCWARLYTYLANSILQFGIDPVLRIEKINSDMDFLERTRSVGTVHSSVFDSSRSMSTSSESSTTTNNTLKARMAQLPSVPTPTQPLPQHLPHNLQQHYPQPPVSKSSVPRSMPTAQSYIQKATKAEIKLSKRISTRAGRDDEKECVIM